MPGLLQNVILEAVPDASTRTVRLAWSDGSVTQADFRLLGDRGVFAAFNDAAFFRQVRILDDGHILAWPGALEFDADALWFDAHPEDAPAETAMQPS